MDEGGARRRQEGLQLRQFFRQTGWGHALCPALDALLKRAAMKDGKKDQTP